MKTGKRWYALSTLTAMCLMLLLAPLSAQAKDDEIIKDKDVSYLKYFSQETSSTTHFFRCEERFDKVLLDEDGQWIPPDDTGYISQYDPILSANVLCYGHYVGGAITGTVHNLAYDLNGQHNEDGTPLQLWEVYAYCYDTDEPNVHRMPIEVILTCMDHEKLADK